jgi:hypothetical protein
MSEDEDSNDMYLKVYHVGREVLIAVCDCDLMGRKFEEGDLRVEIRSDFFGEARASARDVEQALADATMANFIGKRTVALAVDLEYVYVENVLFIEGIPCAQMVRM